MTLETEILRDYSKPHVLRLAAYVGTDTERFATLYDLFVNGDYRMSQRASRVLDQIVEQHPYLLEPYHESFFATLDRSDVHIAVRRNAIRMLQFVAIPEQYQSQVIAYGFQWLNDATQPPAIKAFSLTVLFKLVQTYPELASELRYIIEDRLPYESPSFRSRAVKILQKLKKPRIRVLE